MSTTQQQSFETHGPTRLFVEIGRGAVRLRATETTETTVRVSGSRAEDVQIARSDDEISVVAPRQRAGFLGRDDHSLRVDIELPTGSDVAVRTGSADIALDGSFAQADLKSGSGDVVVERLTAPGQVETGSGDVRITAVESPLRVKSGSGDVRVEESRGALACSTGSGDVVVGHARGALVAKTGSGDVAVVTAYDDLSFSSGSGDLEVGSVGRGRLIVKSASGGARIGVPAGTPVWTDITTVTGDVRSDLEPTGAPAEGQEHLEIRAKTASGSVVLHQI